MGGGNAGVRWDAIVLGGGVSGLVAASVLSQRREGRGDRGSVPSVLVLDDYPRLGGNHTSVDIGPYTFDIGSFVFSEHTRFLTHFPRMLPLMANQQPGTVSTARISPALRLARYPFDLSEDLLRPGLVSAAAMIGSALHGRLAHDQNLNAESFCRHWVGDRVYRQTGLKHYMTRLLGEDPAQIESDFAHKRLGWIKRNAGAGAVAGRLIARLRPRRARQPGAGRLLVRPRAGFEAMYRVAEEDLGARGVTIRTDAGLTRIEPAPGGGNVVHLADGARHETGCLISTIPLHQSLPLCGLDLPGCLPTASLLSLFVSFEGERGFDANTLYNFTHEGRWKRLTMHSDFYGHAGGRAYFSVEIALRAPEADPAQMLAEFRDLADRVGIFRGDLRLEGARLTSHAYPVHLQGASAATSSAIAQLRSAGVLSFGRQGGFDYQPTATVSAYVAERALSGR
ncbi:NAD(P)-binding protein [Acidimangrovimonas sediminis]|uniref:NAD(P)-binding protein n=1 Tax=Acidimangrovimonas sediminis TaxID=2056283 RepID=UPI000C8099B0|nr:NAD(P)-binding protein [Acidimangrovimonas sediminis]